MVFLPGTVEALSAEATAFQSHRVGKWYFYATKSAAVLRDIIISEFQFNLVVIDDFDQKLYRLLQQYSSHFNPIIW